MPKNANPYFQTLMSLLLIVLLLSACQSSSKNTETPAEPSTTTSSEKEATVASPQAAVPRPKPAPAAPRPKASAPKPAATPVTLPSYPNHERLLSRITDPSEKWLAMAFNDKDFESFADNKTNIRFYQKKDNGEWNLVDSVVLYEEGRKCFTVSRLAYKSLGRQSGFYLKTEAGRMGTAWNGILEYDYIIYVPGAPSASVYRNITAARTEDQMKTIRQGSGNFRAFLIQQITGSKPPVTEADTFHRSWLDQNKHLYDKMEQTNTWFAIHLPEFSASLIDSFSSENRVHNQDLTVQGGFVEPALAYSKKADQTYVLWVPAGWPNGGGWGFRSLYARKVSPDQQITISNQDDVHILVDFPRQRVMFLDTLVN